MFKGTLAVLCGKVSGVWRLCGREIRDYLGYSEGGFRGSCGPALKAAGRHTHAYSFICCKGDPMERR